MEDSDQELANRYRDRREYNRNKQRETRARYRNEAIKRYGGKCACCGESERAFLTFDHVNGGGHVERKTLHGKTFYRQLAEDPIRKDIRILCANCNLATSRGERCPHLDAA